MREHMVFKWTPVVVNQVNSCFEQLGQVLEDLSALMSIANTISQRMRILDKTK